MVSIQSWRTPAALTVVLLLAGCQVRFGPVEGDKKNGGGVNAVVGGDPAEQAAIQAVKQHEGYVSHEDNQPTKPVIAVSVYRPSFTDANLKDLAAFTKVRKISLPNTKIT